MIPIGTVSLMTRLSPRQIRYYEARGLIKPARSKGNRRLYSKLDVERLMYVRELLNEGLGLNTIRELIRDVREGGEEERAYWEQLLPAHLPQKAPLTSMNMLGREEIVKFCRGQNVHFIRLQFTAPRILRATRT
ncbi:MAG: MerR family transcriptional regulator [Firmicutes bacterium]|nr:MerR family transcriptional regulator [Bacillota bacterium]